MDTSRKLAFIQLDGAKDLLPLAEGCEISGWVLAEIYPDHIRLMRGEQDFEQMLREFHKSGGG